MPTHCPLYTVGRQTSRQNRSVLSSLIFYFNSQWRKQQKTLSHYLSQQKGDYLEFQYIQYLLIYQKIIVAVLLWVEKTLKDTRHTHGCAKLSFLLYSPIQS